MKLTKKQKDFFIKKHEEAKNKNKNKDMNMPNDVFVEIIEDIITKLNKRELVCSMVVSQSGMTRRFGFLPRYNYVFNVIYNGKISYNKVKVWGCGMDMLFHLMHFCFRTINKLGLWALEYCQVI